MKRCVVLGANGFLGSNIVGELLSAGHSVLACDLSRDFANLKRHGNPKLSLSVVDFLDREAVSAAVSGADWVFHLVSTTLPASSNKNMSFDVETNVVSTIRLLEACVQSKVEKFVFASSGGTVYGRTGGGPTSESCLERPMVSYGIGKLAIERYCALFHDLHGLDTVCLRVSNPYGPGHQGTLQGAIPVFLKRIVSREPIVIWGDGSVVRDYLYVTDVARAFRLAAEYEGSSRIINIGSGVGISLNQLLDMLRKVVDRPFEVRYEEGRAFDVPSIILDIGLAKQQLKWQPEISLEEGLRRNWTAISTDPGIEQFPSFIENQKL
jgi:UDP-glucose 4-epimerase